MRTTSTAKFVMYYDGEPDSSRATTPQDYQSKLGHNLSGDESDANRIPTPTTKLYRLGRGEFQIGNKKNKIWDKVGSGSGTISQGSFGRHETQSEENLSTLHDNWEFGLSSQYPTMCKSASTFLERLTMSDGDVLPMERLKPGFTSHSSPLGSWWEGVCNVTQQTLKKDPSAPRDLTATPKGVKSTRRIGWAHLGFRWIGMRHHRYRKWIPRPWGTPWQLQRVPNIYIDMAWPRLGWSLPWVEWSIYITLSLQCVLNLQVQRCKHLLDFRIGLEKLDTPEHGFPSFGPKAF